ncbi:hypothetical protein ACFL0Q_06025 [Thermodesulfobacteriota bacterium]
MGSRFSIFTETGGEVMHIWLTGYFDESSASRLMNVLTENIDGVYRAIIHTGTLSAIHPSGRVDLDRSFSELRNKLSRVVFTGYNAQKIAPKGSMVVF